jgi:hypothetical protein
MSADELLVVGVLPRISAAGFEAFLREVRSPAAAEAQDSWTAVASEGVDPLFALAIFWHESRCGTTGVVAAHDLRNPGATRSSRTGVGEPVVIPGRGQFWRYPSWAHGFRDLARRLVDPNFTYRRQGAWSVERIIPIWAPASDGNVPSSYIAAVRSFMAQRGSPPLGDLPLRLAWVPAGAPNRPAYDMRPTWITIHETANEAPGADAEAHRRFVHAGGGPEGVSFHFVVDDKTVIQLLPLVENGWHAGDGANGPGNRTSVGIELCVNAGSDWERAQENGARLAAALCRAFGLPVERVVPHQHWSGKQCPRRILAAGFERFRSRVRAAMGLPLAKPAVIQLGPFGKHLGHGFLDFWRELERVHPSLPLRVLGWPRSEEFSQGDITYQVFERAVLKYDSSEGPDWRVHVALLDEATRAVDIARERGLL